MDRNRAQSWMTITRWLAEERDRGGADKLPVTHSVPLPGDLVSPAIARVATWGLELMDSDERAAAFKRRMRFAKRMRAFAEVIASLEPHSPYRPFLLAFDELQVLLAVGFLVGEGCPLPSAVRLVDRLGCDEETRAKIVALSRLVRRSIQEACPVAPAFSRTIAPGRLGDALALGEIFGCFDAAVLDIVRWRAQELRRFYVKCSGPPLTWLSRLNLGGSRSSIFVEADFLDQLSRRGPLSMERLAGVFLLGPETLRLLSRSLRDGATM